MSLELILGGSDATLFFNFVPPSLIAYLHCKQFVIFFSEEAGSMPHFFRVAFGVFVISVPSDPRPFPWHNSSKSCGFLLHSSRILVDCLSG